MVVHIKRACMPLENRQRLRQNSRGALGYAFRMPQRRALYRDAYPLRNEISKAVKRLVKS